MKSLFDVPSWHEVSITVAEWQIKLYRRRLLAYTSLTDDAEDKAHGDDHPASLLQYQQSQVILNAYHNTSISLNRNIDVSCCHILRTLLK